MNFITEISLQHSVVLVTTEVSVCLSVRPSVTPCCPIKTTQARIKKSPLLALWKTVCYFHAKCFWIYTTLTALVLGLGLWRQEDVKRSWSWKNGRRIV